MFNEEYKLDLKIKLLFLVERYAQQRLPQVGRSYEGLGSEMFKISVDVPVELNSLEGTWRVKESMSVYLAHYTIPEVENVGIMLSERANKAIRYALNALRKTDIRLYDTIIQLSRRPNIKEVLKELGEVGWIWIGDIKDTHLREVGMYGRRLQNSEVVEDLLTRGGRVKATIIKNDELGMRITLSEKGTMYSQVAIEPQTMALGLTNFVKILKKHRLIDIKQ